MVERVGRACLKSVSFDRLLEELGGEVVKIAFLIELVDLKGRERLKDYDVVSVITYEGE